MAQSKINPAHPVTRTSIASDRQSAIGWGALNRGEGKGHGAGSMAGAARPLSRSPGE